MKEGGEEGGACIGGATTYTQCFRQCGCSFVEVCAVDCVLSRGRGLVLVRGGGACRVVGGGLRSEAALVDVRLDVVSLPPRSSSPTVAGCRLGGYPCPSLPSVPKLSMLDEFSKPCRRVRRKFKVGFSNADSRLYTKRNSPEISYNLNSVFTTDLRYLPAALSPSPTRS